MAKQTKEPLGEHAERERAMAKALSMSILFERKYYKNIVKILNKKENISQSQFEKELRTELDVAGLEVEEQDWAINYLKCYDKELAKKTDNKWPVHPDAQEYHW